jgi:D-aspartate ligase
VPCPRTANSQRFMDWLLRFGEREPGHVLYPTSDDLAYLFAQHAAEIRKWFRVYQPPVQSVLTLLDKKSLLFAARQAGADGATTWFPEDAGALERIAREARFPLLIKPRTQVLWPAQHKGTRVDRREDLVRAYSSHMRRYRYSPLLLADHPELERPMLQEYHPETEEHIDSVAGFIDASGQIFAARAAIKLLQQPRRLGVGVCFEDAPLDPATADAIVALCRNIGYFGVFEAEFIANGNHRLLIDFNPRYYNQMGFEVARGLPLPLLVHAAACGDEQWLRTMALRAQAAPDGPPPVYCDRYALAMIVALQRASGRMGGRDSRRWQAWYARNHRHAIDPAFDGQDIVPGLLATGRQLWNAMRHPRWFLRSMVLNE